MIVRIQGATTGAYPGYVTVVETPKTGDKASQMGKLFREHSLGSLPAHYRIYSRYAGSNRTVLKDLSQDGFGLLSGERLRPNAIIELTVDVQGEHHRLFGRVIWCNRRESAYDVGARFLNAEDPGRADMMEQLCQEMVWRRTAQGRDDRPTGYGVRMASSSSPQGRT